jgi:hypothetical protein
MAIHEQFAWTGSPTGDPQDVVRIEGATWRGRPVWFDVQWPTGSRAVSPRSATGEFVSFVMFVLMLLLTSFIAWRNWTLHRVDLRGALQLQAVVYVTTFTGGTGVPVVLLAYLALEPYVRRYWPDSLISWQRLSRGGIRDPLVATHVLAGVLAATVMALLVFPALESLVTDLPLAGARHDRLSGSIGSWAALARGVGAGPINALIFLLLVVLMRLSIRRLWPADVLAVALFNVPNYFGMGESVTLMAMMLGPSLVWIWLMRRFGFLSLLVLFTLAPMLMFLPHHLDGGWLGQRLMIFYAVPLLVAAWAVWVIVSARQQSPQGSPAYP